MEQTLKQVGDLLLGAVPTILLLLLLYGFFTVLVYKPLQRVLGERRSRMEGAVEKARAAIALAEAKTYEYELRLRENKLAVFRAQEARRQLAQQARSEMIELARRQADEQIRDAKSQIERETEIAKSGLSAEADRLATSIIDTVLRPVRKGEAPTAGTR
jgi:F-type H+-transporting ATPase subunit b